MCWIDAPVLESYGLESVLKLDFNVRAAWTQDKPAAPNSNLQTPGDAETLLSRSIWAQICEARA